MELPSWMGNAQSAPCCSVVPLFTKPSEVIPTPLSQFHFFLVGIRQRCLKAKETYLASVGLNRVFTRTNTNTMNDTRTGRGSVAKVSLITHRKRSEPRLVADITNMVWSETTGVKVAIMQATMAAWYSGMTETRASETSTAAAYARKPN